MDLPSITQKDHFGLLSSVSNFHWMSLPSVKDPKHLTNETHIGYSQHFLFDTNAASCQESYNRKYIPPSPRNRLMYLMSSEEAQAPTFHLLRHLHMKDRDEDTSNPPDMDDHLLPPLKKRRTHTRRIVSVTERAVYESVGAGLNTLLNSANPNHGIYADFREQLLCEGMIRWRTHSEDMDICVMNDYHPSHGVLLPNSFVHVTCYKDEGNGPVVKCTCAIFALIQRSAHQGTDLWPQEEVIPDQSLTCMHCRYYTEFLLGAWAKVFQGTFNLTKAEEMVKDSLQYMDQPIQLIGNVLPFATTKFSIKGDDDFATVHISFPQNKCYAKCLNGMCAANMRNKKKIPKTVSIKEKSKLCPHIRTMAEHLEYVKSFFPAHFEPQEQDPEEIGNERVIQLIEPDMVNQDDGNLKPERPVVFNQETGLWDFPALSKHTPLEEDDITLMYGTQKRNNFTISTNMNSDTGIYQENEFSLKPTVLNPDGSARICGCGLIYSADIAPEYQFTANFIPGFADTEYNIEMLKAMARLLFMLSGDAAMSTVAPFPAHQIILTACADALANRRNMQGTEDLKHWAFEIADLLMLAQQHDLTEVITNFCEELINKVKDVHKGDDPAPQANRKPGTYDPRSGTAYYFTEHGDQLRDLPQYDVCASSLKNHDDIPGVDRPCRKFFPEVSFGGFGYLFLWFCPIHGHSYGFHMIAGSEGRKDPFASLYKYCEEMREHVFYDFACHLSEYCLNREPELFKNTRFWHDLFHLIGHLCGYNFKSGRVTGLEGINTEICEQWNSFLQSVKYTASHFSQDHFAFFLQYFLCRMNREKTKRFRQQASVAVAGRL